MTDFPCCARSICVAHDLGGSRTICPCQARPLRTFDCVAHDRFGCSPLHRVIGRIRHHEILHPCYSHSQCARSTQCVCARISGALLGEMCYAALARRWRTGVWLASRSVAHTKTDFARAPPCRGETRGASLLALGCCSSTTCCGCNQCHYSRGRSRESLRHRAE